MKAKIFDFDLVISLNINVKVTVFCFLNFLESDLTKLLLEKTIETKKTHFLAILGRLSTRASTNELKSFEISISVMHLRLAAS